MVTDAERDKLWRQLRSLIGGLVKRFHWQTEEHGDMVADYYVRFHELLEAYDPEKGTPLMPYVICKLEWYAYSRWRAEKVRRHRSARLCLNFQAVEPDPAREWDEAILLSQLAARLPEALARLGPGQRQAVVLYYLDGLGYDEIAAITGVLNSTLRSHVRHGLNNLRADPAFQLEG